MTNIADNSRQIDQSEFADPAIVIVSTWTPPIDMLGGTVLTDPAKKVARPRPYDTSRVKSPFWVTCGGRGLYLAQYLSPYEEPKRRRIAIVAILTVLAAAVWLAIQSFGAYLGADDGSNWALLPLLVASGALLGFYLPAIERKAEALRAEQSPMGQLIVDLRRQAPSTPTAYIEIANYRIEANIADGLKRLVVDVVRTGHIALCLAASDYERDAMDGAGLVEIRRIGGLSLHTTPRLRERLKV